MEHGKGYIGSKIVHKETGTVYEIKDYTGYYGAYGHTYELDDNVDHSMWIIEYEFGKFYWSLMEAAIFGR